MLGGIATRLPATLELIFVAMAIALAVGIPLGILAASRKGGATDAGVRVGSVVGISMPVFWLGLLLQVLMSAVAALLPATSRISLETSVLHPIPKITGFYLFDSLVDGRLVRLPRRLDSHHPARDHPRGLSGRPDHADDARMRCSTSSGRTTSVPPGRSASASGSCSGGSRCETRCRRR